MIRMMRRALMLIFGVALWLSSATAVAGDVSIALDTAPAIRAVAALLKTPDAMLDLADAKLLIDQRIDPTIDVLGTHGQLKDLAKRVEARFPAGANDAVKMELLLNSLYQPGPWNDYRPFSYDLDDPFGRVITNKLLPTYLRTRKGNCVSMPILIVVIGQKLGLEITLATAPEHVLAKFHNPVDGQWVNVEAASGGFKLNSSYRRESGITELAMKNEIYLRPLSRRESAAVMTATLMEFYGQSGQQEARIALADLALQINPKDVTAMLQKGNAYFRLMGQGDAASGVSVGSNQHRLRPDSDALRRSNLFWFEKAEALGWRMPSRPDNEAYRRTIQSVRTAQKVGE